LRRQREQTRNNKNLLFGDKKDEQNELFRAQTEELFEKQTEENIEETSDSALKLKSLVISINDEVNAQNTLLGKMTTDVDKTGGSLKGTMSRLNAMVKTGGSKNMCYLALLIVVVFILLYYIISYLQRESQHQHQPQ